MEASTETGQVTIANSPNSSSKGSSGKGSGGSKSQQRAAGREGGRKSG
jgi:hypothetical protein